MQVDSSASQKSKVGSMSRVNIPIQRLLHADNIDLPKYATEGAAGFDLPAAIKSEIVIAPGDRALVPTGFKIAIPLGFEGQLRPRSGLAITHGITLLNSPGTIDSDFRGEISAILINLGTKPVTIKRGDRIAQMVIAEHVTVSWALVDTLTLSERGAGGFGSTGV